jgi:hypothetical protein
MRRPRVTALYGAGPLHLIALVASFAIAAAAVVGFFDRPGDVVGVLVWLGAAAVLHDLVLLPAYSLIDRITIGRLPPAAAGDSVAVTRAVSPAAYIRIPAALSGLLLLVSFPVIFALGRRAEFVASGITEHGYLARWLLLTGAMFALSGAAFAVASARAGRGGADDAGRACRRRSGAGRGRADRP